MDLTMKNIILPLLVATLFFSSNTIFAAENGFGASMQADSNKLFQLQTAQDNNKEQFDKAFKKKKTWSNFLFKKIKFTC